MIIALVFFTGNAESPQEQWSNAEQRIHVFHTHIPCNGRKHTRTFAHVRTWGSKVQQATRYNNMHSVFAWIFRQVPLTNTAYQEPVDSYRMCSRRSALDRNYIGREPWQETPFRKNMFHLFPVEIWDYSSELGRPERNVAIVGQHHGASA